MRIGLHTVAFDWPGGTRAIGPTLTEIARTADDAGFASLWVMDHLLQLGMEYGEVHGPEDGPMLEGVATLGYLAGITKHVELGLLVGCNLYREPGLLVKSLTTVDVLSGGRTWFGIGTGWFDREARALGFGPLPPWSERHARLEETIAIAKRMWSGDRSAFEGAHYLLEEPINSPAPLRRPPLLIGGDSAWTMRLVAREADACNFVVGAPIPSFGELYRERDRSVEAVRDRLELLRSKCEEVGRPYDAIEKTMATYVKVGRGGMGTRELVDHLAPFAELGIEHVMLIVTNAFEIAPIELIGRDVIPPLADVVPRRLTVGVS